MVCSECDWVVPEGGKKGEAEGGKHLGKGLGNEGGCWYRMKFIFTFMAVEDAGEWE